MSDLQFDVVVVGGGMAGLAAAVTAGAEGARVAVLEKTSAIGGSAAISSGYLWTAPDFETLKSRIPLGDSDLGRILVSDFEDVVELERSTGVELSPRVGGLLGFGQGYVVDIKGLFERWASKIEGRGGWIVPRTSAVRLHRGADGVDGVLTTGPDGQLEISARSVVLATGGFQGDRALMASFIGLDAAEMPVRSAPGSVGDGFRMASDVGAAASSALGAFYGHLIPSPLSRFEEPDFLPLTQYHSNRCLLVNRRGDRFMDDGRRRACRSGCSAPAGLARGPARGRAHQTRVRHYRAVRPGRGDRPVRGRTRIRRPLLHDDDTVGTRVAGS